MPFRRRNRGRGRQGARLPQARPEGEARSITPARSVSGPTPRRKTVLVVEDNATIGGLMVALLREEGYRALRAWDGGEAVKMARDRRPELIMLDLSLPYPEGLQVLDQLKAQPETSEVPIIVVSGNTLQLSADERELLAECVSKPVDIDRLINYVRRALGDPELDIPEKVYTGNVDQHLHSW